MHTDTDSARPAALSGHRAHPGAVVLPGALQAPLRLTFQRVIRLLSHFREPRLPDVRFFGFTRS